MKIAVDCRSLTGPPTGVANLLIGALNELSREKTEWTFYLLFSSNLNKEAEKRIEKRENVIILKRPLLNFYNGGITWYICKIWFLLKEIKPDYFWTPATILPPFIPGNVKTLVTVNDLVAKQFRQTMLFMNKLINILLFDRSINKADILWAISKYTKEEVEKHFPNRKSKNIFVGCSIDNSIYKKIILSENEKLNLLKKYGLNEKFILFVGTVEPRKNIKFLLSLMPELVSNGYNLLVVGASGWGKTGIADIINDEKFPADKVIFAGFVTTDELIKLYNIAAVFVSTSKNEGFGLPQLEAMACNCPVVTSHNSAMIEVVEGAGITVKGWNKQDWLAAINKAYNNKTTYSKQGLIRAEEYQWKNIIARFPLTNEMS